MWPPGHVEEKLGKISTITYYFWPTGTPTRASVCPSGPPVCGTYFFCDVVVWQDSPLRDGVGLAQFSIDTHAFIQGSL